MIFTTHNKVRMHDTDMAGILYFARQYRFAHDALEEFMEHHGYSFDQMFHNDGFVFVIVHSEADYLASLSVGDKLTIQLSIERIGQTSFTIFYEILRDKQVVGTVKTVHVCLDNKTRTKIAIPEKFRQVLSQYALQ